MRTKSLLEVLGINVTTIPPTTAAAPSYDHKGALWYVIMLVTVYAMAIFFMIVSHVRRRADKREVDREINQYLRSAPLIKEAEERQRRENLKKAMKPFIEFALNKRTLGIQTEIKVNGELSTSNSFEASFGIPGNPSYTEHIMASNEVKITTFHGQRLPFHHSRRLSMHPPGSQRLRDRKVSRLANEIFLVELREIHNVADNEKVIQCDLDETQTLRMLTVRGESSSVGSGNSLQSSISNNLSTWTGPPPVIEEDPLEDFPQLQYPRRKSILHTDEQENVFADWTLHEERRDSESGSDSSLMEIPMTLNKKAKSSSKSVQSNKSSLRLDDLDNWDRKSKSLAATSRKSIPGAVNDETSYVPMVCAGMPVFRTPERTGKKITNHY